MGTEALDTFKGLIADQRRPEDEDNDFLNWLHARNNDPAKAAQMYKESVAFRGKMKVDTIMKDYESPKVLKDYLAGGFCGYDKEGSPVRIELFGHLDMKGLMQSAKQFDMEKTKLQHCEYTKELWDNQSKKLGKSVLGLTVIFDMDSVGMHVLWKPGLQMYLHLVKVLEDNYPEMMKRMFVINAPGLFPVLYQMCRPFVSEDMRKKIYVLGTNYRDTLLEYIDSAELPEFLGGTLRDPDGNPRCPSKICQGGPVPANLYLKDITLSDQDLQTTTLPKSGEVDLEFTVSKGNLLRWEFVSDSTDFSFEIHHRSAEGLKSVFNQENVDTHLVPEDGSLKCGEDGTYLVRFKNKSAWKSPEVRYLIEVIECNPKEVQELIHQ